MKRIVLAALLVAFASTAQAQVIGGMDQYDGAPLPIDVIEGAGTPVVGMWNGSIIHEYGDWQTGQEVSLRLTDCDRNTMNIAWRAHNRDGLGPMMRGPMGTCIGRFELRAAGDHEFSINYYFNTQDHRRSTAQDSHPSRWRASKNHGMAKRVLGYAAAVGVGAAIGYGVTR